MTALQASPEELATSLGAHPARLLGLLVVLAGVAVALLVVAFHFANGHARKKWDAHVGRFGYLVLHLALGLGGVVGIAVFIALAAGIGRGGVATRVDLALANALHGATSPLVTSVLRGVTFLGEGWSQATTGVLVAIGLLKTRRKLWTLAWVIALAGGGILNTVLKHVYARPRPIFADPILSAGGFSFPSGHSMGTFILAGMAAYLGVLHTNGRLRHAAIVALALAWAVTMGYSRMYLGVHYLTDVVGGYAAGSCWLAVCISGVEIARRRPRHAGVSPATVGRDA
jgi:membrane-associated phospholipid phosphatase